MTVGISAGAAQAPRTDAPAGLAGLLSGEGAPPSSGDGRDFASILRDVPQTPAAALRKLAGKGGKDEGLPADVAQAAAAAVAPETAAPTDAASPVGDDASVEDDRSADAGPATPVDTAPQTPAIAVAAADAPPAAPPPVAKGDETSAAIDTSRASGGRKQAIRPDTAPSPRAAEQPEDDATTPATETADTPAVPGEATRLIALANRGKAERAPDAGTDKANATDTRPEPRAGDGKNPVRGAGLVTPQGREIAGLAKVASVAAPNAAVVTRVAAAQAAPDAPATDAATPDQPVATDAVAADIAASDVVRPPKSDRQKPVAPAAAKPAEGQAAASAPAPTDASARADRRATRDDAGTAPADPSTAAAVATGDATTFAVTPTDGTQPPAAPSVQPGAVPSISVGGALGQQVVDIGLSGQWINDIARQIASIADNPGHGSFQFASSQLGSVRVDIAPGARGTDIVLTVDNADAQHVLGGERKRLIEDAQLASVRVGDVRIDHVAPAAASSAARQDADTGGQQGNPSSQSSAQAALSQGNGQGGQQQARQDATALGQQANGNSPKAPFTRSVLNDDAQPGQAAPGRGRRADNARYA